MASTSTAAYRQGIYKSAFVRKVTRWLDASPHPPLALEIAPDRVAGARFTRTGSLDGFAIEELPAGALLPSAVETNIANPTAVKAAVNSVFDRLRAKDEVHRADSAGPGDSRFPAAFRSVSAFAARSDSHAALEAEKERAV